MTTVTRTTITIPEHTLRQLKMKAVMHNTSVSGLINKIVNDSLHKKKKKKQDKDPMKLLGVFNIGINKIYDNRDELYYEDDKRHLEPGQ